MTILVVMAMEAEASPVREKLGLTGTGDQLHEAFPARVWSGDGVALAVNGVDPRFGVDSIASQPAVTTTLHAIERVGPDIVVSAGTAGGFMGRGGAIGSIYLADRCVYHDRRVDLPGFDVYGVGDYPVADLSGIAAELGWGVGTISTGNALDAPSVDVTRMDAVGTVAKDMEAAAVAWTCERLGVPFTALKVVTDLVDTEAETAEEFLANLQHATRTLAAAMPDLVEALAQQLRG